MRLCFPSRNPKIHPKSQTYINLIDDNVLNHILGYLANKDILNFLAMNKQFKSRIENSMFYLNKACIKFNNLIFNSVRQVIMLLVASEAEERTEIIQIAFVQTPFTVPTI